ncbi:MAG: hypothetical protein PHX20_05855 [Candidatus Omnitrophica bacterium]|nr:hypothetical protein [Candidatus Omnitrophota bacterium]
MRTLFIIICLCLAVNVYAGQTKDADSNYARNEAPEASPGTSPDWANANAEPSFSGDESEEPSYSRTDEPSFGDDRNND